MRLVVALVAAPLILASCNPETASRRQLVPGGDAAVDGGGPGSVDAGPGERSCESVHAGIVATVAPPYACAQTDAIGQAVIAELNGFWLSQVGICGCAPDFPGSCAGAEASYDRGWIFYDPASGATSGGLAAATYVFAHAFGHEIQGHEDAVPTDRRARELGADCLAGYYLGFSVCRDRARATDLVAAIAADCIAADGTGDPTADAATHGSCAERAESVGRGIEAYLAGADALTACGS
jgi:hypothetical protein